MDIATALTKLFHALPARKGNASELTEAYKLALSGGSQEALGVAVLRYIRGEVDGQSVTYAPTPPELARVVRDVDSHFKKLRNLDEERTAPRIEYKPQGPSDYVKALNAEYQAWHAGARAGPLMLRVWEKHFPQSGTFYNDTPQPFYDGRAFLCVAPKLAIAQEMAKRGDVPPGSLYVARLGAFYSPKPEGHRQGDGGSPLTDGLQS